MIERAQGVPRNVWVASATSFLTDVSSEMVMSLLPLFLANVLGARTATIGLIEGVAESASSLFKVASGAISDRLGRRKWLAVAGYALSTLAKPGFAVATTWTGVAAVRWTERLGKGVRTAPRDALVADAVDEKSRGLAFGLHRAADTAGAVIGIGIAIAVLASVEPGAHQLDAGAFRTLVWLSVIPAAAAVVILALGARESRGRRSGSVPRLRGLGRPFAVFLAISAIFDLADFSDAFMVLRAQERGLAVSDILWVLLGFNLVYAVLATPAGRLSDRFGRRRVLAAGWAIYGVVQLGFAGARDGGDVAALFLFYGASYALTVGTGRAFIADLVPAELRGTAYGGYHAVLGAIDLPSSLLAGVLWQGVGDWQGLGAAAPFVAASVLATTAAALLVLVPALRERE